MNSRHRSQIQAKCQKIMTNPIAEDFPVHFSKQTFTEQTMTPGFEPSTSESDATPEPASEGSSKQSRLISKVLAPALRLWLRSQVEHIENLQVKIEAGDRQILSGYIQQVFLSAEQAIYQGLSLGQIQLSGQNIRVNLSQVVRGKPLRLLEPIPIQGTVLLQESNINASLNAPLLKAGVTQFLITFLRAGGTDTPVEEDLNLQDLRITLEENQVVIAASLISNSGTVNPIAIRTGFELQAPNLLALKQPQWLPHATAKRGLKITELEGYAFDLGEETELEEVCLQVGQVSCRGRLTVRP